MQITEHTERYSFVKLKQAILGMLNGIIRANEKEHHLSAEAYQNQEEQRRELSDCIRNCCSGNIGAREVVKELILQYLIHEAKLDDATILYAVPFHHSEQMSAHQLLESMIYLKDKENKNQGFRILYEENELLNQTLCISEQCIREVWKQLQPLLRFEDKLHILVQLLYAEVAGLGVIDTLNYQRGCIEEIQLGMNGHATRNYDYTEECTKTQSCRRYSTDSIHILVRGRLIWLSCLSFGSEEELQRILRNLIKDSRTGELTRKQPKTVIDTIDGRRISVSRPPMTDTWVGLIRKFDSASCDNLEKLYGKELQGEELVCLLREILQNSHCVAITGEMASGKTTLLRACLAELQKQQRIRIIEADSFELNARDFLPEGNVLTMRIAEGTPEEEVLAFARKTTGQVFVVGEVNSQAVASMVVDLSKISSQLLFSAHYASSSSMITDFVNAKLCVGGYKEERLAEQEVLNSLEYDIHLVNKNGKRRIEYINRICRNNSLEEKNALKIIPVLIYNEQKDSYQFYKEEPA